MLLFCTSLLLLVISPQMADAQTSEISRNSVLTVGQRFTAVEHSKLTSETELPRKGSGDLPNIKVAREFNDYCVVAWPSAPELLDGNIVMTMSCQHVPEDQYLFTQVQYSNSHLRVTPSTGLMHVVGKVVGVAKSGLGYKELIVVASKITF